MNEQWHQRQRPRAAGPAGTLRPAPGTGQAPQPAVLVHELVTVAAAGAAETEECARRLAAALPPRARSALLDALTRTGPRHETVPDGYQDSPDGYEAGLDEYETGPEGYGAGPDGYGAGGGLFFDGPEYPLPAARSHLSLLPACPAPGPDRPPAGTGTGNRVPGNGNSTGVGDSGGNGDGGGGGADGGGLWPEPYAGPPAAVVRLRFADAVALERAGACFEGALSDPATGTLQVPADAGVEALRAVLAVLDAAALAPESLTVHSNELDDVFAAFTGLL
ncbi:hypothetical protein AB0M19_33150 [Streptomyces sp. NPDC051920]|uniref:hypothetical protein n=1 Tax=Streptomyces sp. NPDC051920 TaxID=3155523 RepID=UPI0034182CB6